MHDAEIEHLVEVVLPATGQYPNGLSTTYEYAGYDSHPAMRHNILRVLDAEKRLMVENQYAGPDAGWEFNSVVRQRVGGFEYQFGYEQIQFVDADAANVDTLAAQTQVAPPDGSLHTYTFNYRGDLLDQRFRLNRDGSFRVVSRSWQHDAEGNVIGAVGPDGLQTVLTFDSANPDPCARRNLLKVELISPFPDVDPSRIVYLAEYDPRFQLPVRTKDESGAETVLKYDFDEVPFGSSGRLRQVELPVVTGADGLPQHSVLGFEHDARAQLMASITAEGKRTELSYFSEGFRDGLLSTITIDPGGAGLVSGFEYNSAGFSKAIELPGGRTTAFTHNALGQLEEVLAPTIAGMTGALRMQFDDSGSIARVERPAGSYSGVLDGTSIVDEYERNEVGSLGRITLAGNTKDRREWLQCVDHEGRATSVWDTLGTRTDRVFGEDGVLLSETAAAGETEAWKTSFSYDRAGRVTRLSDPWMAGTEVEYDVWGRPHKITLPAGAVRTLKWGANDRLLSERVEEVLGGTAVLLQSHSYEYDQRGRMIATTVSSFRDDPAMAVPLTTRWLYDKDDRVLAVLLPRGARFSFEFDASGRRSKETDSHGNVRQFAYDLAGDLAELTIIDAVRGVARTRTGALTHDGRGRLKRVTFLDSVTELDYDDRDFAVQRRVPSGVTRQFGFNAHAQVLENIVDPGGLSLRSQFEYDPNGLLRRYVDPTGSVTAWERDLLGRVTSIKPPDGTTWISVVDPNAGIIEEIAPSGNRIVSETLGATNRVVRMTSFAAPGQENVAYQEFTFDAIGRLVQATSGPELIRRKYDSMGRLIEETAQGKTVGIEYDDATGSRDLIYPDGRRERTDHDPTGQPTKIVLITPGALGGRAGDVLLEIFYSASGLPVRFLYGNDVEGQMIHDDHDRVIRVEYRKGHVMLDSCRVRYDVNGRRTVIQYLGALARNAVHAFDGNGRLVATQSGFALPALQDVFAPVGQAVDIAAARAASSLAVGEEFMLDDADARTERRGLNGGPPDQTYVLGSDHRVIAVDAATVSYNLDGHRKEDRDFTYDLDARNRVRRVRDRATNAVVAELNYDALSRVASGSTTGRAFDRWFAGSTRIQEVAGSAPGATSQHSPHPFLPLPFCVMDATGPNYIHQDEGSSTTCVTDAVGTVLERHLFDVFGTDSSFGADGITPLATFKTEPVWRGMPQLGTTGLFSTPQRLYDSATGVFTSRDPLLYADSPSPYAYAAHNPVDFADPTGFAKEALGTAAPVAASGSASLRTGLWKWLYEDSKGLAWYDPPYPGDVISQIPPVDTGSTGKNFLLNSLISLHNLAARALNTSHNLDAFVLGSLDSVDRLAHRLNVDSELQAAQTMLPMAPAIGIAVEIGPAFRYFASLLRFGRLASGAQVATVEAAALGPIGRVTSKPQFRVLLTRLIRNADHPLHFLLDPATGELRPSTAKGITALDWFENPEIIEAGHYTSAKSLGGLPDRLIVMSAHENRLVSAILEHPRKGGIMVESGIVRVIGGIPFDPVSAAAWVEKGLLSAEALAKAPILSW